MLQLERFVNVHVSHSRRATRRQIEEQKAQMMQMQAAQASASESIIQLLWIGTSRSEYDEYVKKEPNKHSIC